MSDETTELLRLLEEREVNQESIVRSFLRKISPNRDWDYLGEHEHALIAALISDIVATLGSEREKKLESLVRFMEPFFKSAVSHECGCPEGYFEPHGCDNGCMALKELDERMVALGLLEVE